MCENTVLVEVTGQSGRKTVADVDECIADLVKALQAANIKTRECCCGHGRFCGDILLEDGRVLLIVPADQGFDWLCRDGIKWLTEETDRRARAMQNRLVNWGIEARKSEARDG